MEVTNNYNLPKALYRAVAKDTHKAGGDFSVTQLLKSPREFWLKARHDPEIKQDAISMLWALLGTASHTVAERGEDENSIVEEYMKIEFNGVTVTGMLDLFEKGILWDYKTMSVYGVKLLDSQKKAQFIAQLNMYAYMFTKLTGFKVNGLRILAIMRDWVASKAKFDSSYFDFQAQVIEIPLFSEEQQRQIFINRIEYLLKFKDVPDNELPFCSPKYRWSKPPVYKVYKNNNKQAVRGGANFKTCEEAKRFIDNLDPKHKYRVEAISGEEWKRCEYCSSHEFCNQTQYSEKDWRREHKNIVVNMSYDEFLKEAQEW